MGFRNKALSNNLTNSLEDKVSQIDSLSAQDGSIEHTPSGKKSKLTVCDFYKNIFTNMTIPVSAPFIDRLATDFVKWATEDKEAFKLTQFYLKIGMYETTFNRWCKKYPTLQRAKDVAKIAIGNRREIGAIKNKFNPAMIMSQQAKYDDSWRGLEVWRSDLKAKAQQKEDANVKYAIIVEDFSKDDKKKTHNLPEEEK